MQINQEHIDAIKTKFQQMKTKEDLLELVNFAKTQVYGGKAKLVPLKTLTYFANHTIGTKQKDGEPLKFVQKGYKEFTIRKKSGGTRKIHAPVEGLKPIQKALNLLLQYVFTPHQAATGFVTEKSIVDNARVHRGMHYVYNIDLKDFFPSVDMKRIAACLRIPPFNVIDTEEAPLAFLIANLCCTPIEVERKNDKGEWEKKIMSVLPQGAPTSPTITNIVCQKLDRKLAGLARKHGAQYTRYADDITFSSMHNLYQPGSDFLKEMVRIIEGEKFSINPKKTRLQKTGYRKEVTGLVVNEKVNVHRRYIKQIRRWLYLWERYGYVQAEAIFKNDYRADKGHVKKGEPSLQNVLDGKLLFLKMVKGEGDGTYLGLWKRFEKLVGNLELKTLNTESQKKSSSDADANAKSGKIKITVIPLDAGDGTKKLLFDKELPVGLEIPYEEEFDNKPLTKENGIKPILHNPHLTVEFLKNFKYDNDTGLKELVHKPFDVESFDFQKVIDKVKKHPNIINFFHKKESSAFEGELPKPLWLATKNLIELMSTDGLKFFQETKKHPIESPDLARKIQEFKRNYRFGSEKTEYSVLKELILNIARKVNHQDAEKGLTFSFGKEDTSGQFDESQLIFLPNDRIFSMRAGFFTWVPNVKNALWWIFQGILQHSNIDGKREFDLETKTIDIEILRERIPEKGVTQIRLTISDNKSLLKKSSEQLLRDFKGAEPYSRYLRGIADWIVEFDCEDGKSYRLNMLPEDGKIEQLESNVNSLKQILIFYD